MVCVRGAFAPVLMLQQDLGTALIYYATTLFLFTPRPATCPDVPGLVGAGGAAALICDVRSREKARGHLAQSWIYYETSGYQIVQMLMGHARRAVRRGPGPGRTA